MSHERLMVELKKSLVMKLIDFRTIQNTCTDTKYKIQKIRAGVDATMLSSDINGLPQSPKWAPSKGYSKGERQKRGKTPSVAIMPLIYLLPLIW